jgi:cellulose synthase/poly-beta-1,6-N-acetylglucosamine synthase-like glycosyltransferase
MPELKPTISVVVIGRNEGERLRRCLESVRGMTSLPKGHETIYVDSGSSDNSLRIATECGARTIELNAPRPGAALARNAGWRVACADWVLFLDGDTILDPSFPKLALESMAWPSVAAVWGHRREIYPKANMFQRVLDLDWVYAPGYTEFCGGDALFRRAALEKVGGFDPTLIAGEEPEMCSRLRAIGYRILHIDAPMTGHDLAITRFSQYWRRLMRAGYAYAQMATQSRGEDKVRMWAAESRGNAVRALMLLALLALAVIAPWLSTAPWVAFGISLAIFAALVLRTAWKARWKSDDAVSLLYFGAHSHLQQIPIFAGQVAFWWDMLRNRRRGLIEYK